MLEVYLVALIFRRNKVEKYIHMSFLFKRVIAIFSFVVLPFSQVLCGQDDVIPLPITEVAPGIYVHFGVHGRLNKKNHGAIANIGFIVGQRCVAVIDTGGNPKQGQALKAAIEATTDKSICYVINTHVHPDHIFGNIAFKSSGVTFVGHKKLPRAMAMRSGYYLQLADRLMGLKFGEQHLIPPQLVVKDEKRLDLGGRQLVLTAHPTAHTDNDLTIYDAKTKTLWLSDLLFAEHIPVIDGSINGWISELKKLAARTDVELAVPGHGSIVKNWPMGLKQEQAYLEMLQREVRAKIKSGEYLEDAVKSVGLSAKNKWKLFEEFHRKNVTAAFAELEWE